MIKIDRRAVRVLGLVVSFLLPASLASAQANNLQCFRIKDSVEAARYTANLAPADATFAPAPGCSIRVPAKLLCVDTVKTAVSPTPPGSSDGPATQPYLCYQTKCPKADATTKTYTDQFGIHDLAVNKTGLLCTPVISIDPCANGTKDGTESDIDCGGGSCPACSTGDDCSVTGDCSSNVCMGGTCQAPTCGDLVRNQDESDVDCGGGICDGCDEGYTCAINGDCSSNVCMGGSCQAPTCGDLVRNQDESDIDCGGGICVGCAEGYTCAINGDCGSYVCMGGSCQAPSCGDLVRNQDESDVDCGGGICVGCAEGHTCAINGDCVSGACSAGFCL